MGKEKNTPKKSDAFKSERTTTVLASRFSYSQAESTPAHTQVTQAVGPLIGNQMNSVTDYF